MLTKTQIAIALVSLSVAHASASAKRITEPTPKEAHVGKAAATQPRWVTSAAGALKGLHLNIKGNSADSFGNSWWGGGYNANYQIVDWKGNDGHLIIGGATLRVFAKLFFTQREVANVRVGLHNLGSNVTNGSVKVMGKTLKGWHLTDQALKENYTKSTVFFDKTKSFGLGPFSLDFKATAVGNVSVKPNVEMKGLRATLDVTSSGRVNVTGKTGIDVWIASAHVEGSLSPLVEAKLPIKSYVQVRKNRKPCFNVNAKLQIRTMAGKIRLILDYLINTYEKTIADWKGTYREFELVNVGQPCFIIATPTFPIPPVVVHR